MSNDLIFIFNYHLPVFSDNPSLVSLLDISAVLAAAVMCVLARVCGSGRESQLAGKLSGNS